MNESVRVSVQASSSSPSWRIAHISLSFIAAVGSLASLIPFSLVLQKFNGSCPLFSQVPVVANDNVSFSFDLTVVSEKYWGPSHVCSYCLFTFVSSFIYSFIWLWFFSVCASEKVKGMQSLSRPWLVIPPGVVFNFVLTILIFVASGLLTDGVNSFCQHLDNMPVKGCHNAEEAVWKDFPNLNGFYTMLVECQVAMWITSTAWLLGFLVLLLRCCTGADFKVLKVPVPVSYKEMPESVLSSPGPSSV